MKIICWKQLTKTDLFEQTKFWLYAISKIENYFIEEINQRKSCSQKLSKYVTTFDYIDKILIVLSATARGVSIIPFTSVIGALVGISSANFYFNFFFNNWNSKNIIEYSKKKKKKHDEILMFVKIKLNSIDTLISQALIDMDISHEECITILKEKDRYEMMKENKNEESYEIMRFNSVKSKI